MNVEKIISSGLLMFSHEYMEKVDSKINLMVYNTALFLIVYILC